MKGDGAGFKPYNPVTRAPLAVVVSRMIALESAVEIQLGLTRYC